MMLIKPLNPNLNSQMKKAFAVAFKYIEEGQEQLFLSQDFDNVRYQILASQDKIRFSFYCEDFPAIWKYIQSHFVKTHYPEFNFKVPGENGYAITTVIGNNELAKIPLKKDELINNVCERFATFKRNIFSSPYEIVLTATKSGSVAQPVSFSLRTGEKTWISTSKNQLAVFFGISFTEKSEQQIARILLTEFTEAKKHVNNSPIVMVTESQLPSFLAQTFTNEKNAKYEFTNGIISFTFFGNTIQDITNQATLLGNFRHYLHYHIHASKCYLHSRVINRIEMFNKSLNLTKLEKPNLQFIKQ